MLRRRMMMNAIGEATLAYGCYIQDTTGKLWKAGVWNGSATPNGVAVYDESCSFIIALGGDKQLPINSSTVSSSLTRYITEETAIADFDGAGNTAVLISDYGSSDSEAAGYCAAYSFPNGESGYLGSAGEWNVAFKYKSEIDAIIAVLDGDALKTSYWTSTYYGIEFYSYFWFFRWKDDSRAQAGDMNADTITSKTYYSRPFGVLDIEGVGGGSGTAKTENKIEAVFGSKSYVKSQYPVASDIRVKYGTTAKFTTVTISEGRTESGKSTITAGSILSVTPAEDDKYIYTF